MRNACAHAVDSTYFLFYLYIYIYGFKSLGTKQHASLSYKYAECQIQNSQSVKLKD